MINGLETTLTLHLRSQLFTQRSGKYNDWQLSIVEKTYPCNQVAIIVCDMWDDHWSSGAAERVSLMVQRMNATLEIARARGMTIIHAPSDTMDYYTDSSARKRTLEIQEVTAPAEIQHQEYPLPIDDSDGGSDTGETVHMRSWTCQHPAIKIDQKKDYISDNGLQVLAILRKLDIKILLIMGVHTNMCILNRSFAIKQMVHWGMPIALVRDLTDAMYNPVLPPYVSHDVGTSLVVEYIEKFWCPTIVSTDLSRKPSNNPFVMKKEELPKSNLIGSEEDTRQPNKRVHFVVPDRNVRPSSFVHLRDLADTDRWSFYPNNPVLRPGAHGEWDAGALGTMTVLKVGNVIHLYYEAWGVRSNLTEDYSSLQIGHATSGDGLNWTKETAVPVLPKGAGSAWDPFVIYEDGVFKMWYGGGIDNHCDWGYAVSTDSVHFEKKGQISHLCHVEDDHVVHDKTTGRYFMYYWDREFEPMGLFVAESPNETDFDFIHARPIKIEGLHAQTMYKFTHVIQNDGQWEMFFGKFVRPGCKGCHTGMATSPDGVHWKARAPNLLAGIDSEILNVADDLWTMFYGRDGFFDQAGQDIGIAFYEGKLADLAKKSNHNHSK